MYRLYLKDKKNWDILKDNLQWNRDVKNCDYQEFDLHSYDHKSTGTAHYIIPKDWALSELRIAFFFGWKKYCDMKLTTKGSL